MSDRIESLYDDFCEAYRQHHRAVEPEKLIDGLILLLKKSGAPDGFKHVRGWRADWSRGTQTVVIRPHNWILWRGESDLCGAIWDPFIDGMNEVDASIFRSQRYATFDEATQRARKRGRVLYRCDSSEGAGTPLS